VVVLNESPADCPVNELELSVKPAHSFGDVPCAESLKVKVFALRLEGALGVDFITKVIVSSSSWKNVSGWPDALNLKFMLPGDVPE
jgi:hypothetical protein